MINEKQVKRMVEENKIRKLIVKMFLGDRLTDLQYQTIYDCVKNKGVEMKSYGISTRPVFNGESNYPTGQEFIKTETPGWYFSGIFVVGGRGNLHWYRMSNGIWKHDSYKLESYL